MPVLRAGIAAKVNGAWLHSADYPKCSVNASEVNGTLGAAHQWVVEYSGLSGRPDLGYTLRSYRDKPFADVQADVINRTGETVEVGRYPLGRSFGRDRSGWPRAAGPGPIRQFQRGPAGDADPRSGRCASADVSRRGSQLITTGRRTAASLWRPEARTAFSRSCGCTREARLPIPPSGCTRSIRRERRR